MKKISALVLASTLIGTLSIGAIAPAAYAQATASNGDGKNAEQKQERKSKGQHRNVRGGHGFLNSICSETGAERLEKGMEIMAIRIDLTDAQRPAFDDLKTAALTAQTDYAEACTPLKAEKPEGAAEKLKHRTAMMELQLESMNQVLPSFEAFFDTLSDEQKAELNKFGGKKGKGGKGKMQGKNGQRGNAPQGDGPAPANG